jgi:MYXO-CTERM domain-containing protein
VTGGCECALDPSNARSGWPAPALGLLAAALVVRRRRSPNRH